MALNGAWDSEASKSTSIHHKSNPYDSNELMNAFWSDVFLEEKYPYLKLYKLLSLTSGNYCVHELRHMTYTTYIAEAKVKMNASLELFGYTVDLWSYPS